MNAPHAGFKDYFSGHADLYAKARPHYPVALFDWIAHTAPARGLCWDAGCGNGQASVTLAQRFARVIATDPSARQIGNAESRSNIDYRVERAEHTTLAAQSVDAVTVAQALHWFDLSAFIGEVRRVAKPGAAFAAWCYATCSVTPAVDAVVAHLYDAVLGAYWSAERRLTDTGYATLELPFGSVPQPAFEMRVDWNAVQLLAYLASWSAAQKYRTATGRDAIADVAPELRQAWGDPAAVRPVRWPLGLRAGRVV
ncbi:MAG TPA: class I SAM-dependent methyltransferase [Rhodanobacteraceae bacterium]